MYRPPTFNAVTLVSLTLFLQTGCVNVSDLSPADILSGLSDLILRPDLTCEQMQAKFGLAYLPDAHNPADAGIDYEEHWLAVDEQTVIRAWYMPTNLDRGTVVVSCGNTGPMACYLFTARLLTRNGWSTVLYEYEGYGQSGGRPSLDTLCEDLETVVEWTRARTGRRQVTLLGMSLGSIPSIAVAVKQPSAVNAVVLDSPVALGAQIHRFGFLVGGRTNVIISQLDPDLLSDSLICWMEQPLLVFLHERDALATPETVVRLYERAAGPKEIVRFSGLNHARGQFFSTDVYVYHLENFLNEVWSQSDENRSYGWPAEW